MKLSLPTQFIGVHLMTNQIPFKAKTRDSSYVFKVKKFILVIQILITNLDIINHTIIVKHNHPQY